MAKADNLLAVLWLLRSRRRMTAPQLADSLETSVRTIYRYIDALCVSGVPIVAESGPDGGYSLPDNFRSAPLFFEPTELVALFQAAQFARVAGHPYSDALEAGLEKVRRNLTPQQAADLQRHTAGLVVSSSTRGGPVEPWLGPIEQAVADEATLAMIYRKPDEGVAEPRVIDPYGLAYRSGLWYVVAYCHKRQDLREFRVDRIEGLTQTGARFHRPLDFQLSDQFVDDWVPEQVRRGPHVTVKVMGEVGAIERMCTHWYLKHSLVERTAQSAHFRIDEVGRQQLPGYLLTLGQAITILEPADLRQELANLAKKITRHYENPMHP